MARSPNEKAEKARGLYKGGMKLVEIASQLDCSAATIRTWKNRYKWDANENETFQNKNETKRNVSKKSKSEKSSEVKAVAHEVESVMENTELTDKQQLFCIYYIRCFNATKAYQKAYGCGYATAVTNGPALLGNTRIKEAILQMKQDRFNREFLNESDIFQKYMDIAFADVTDFVEFGNEDVDVVLDTGEQKTITVSHVNIKNDADVDGTIISEVSKGKDGVKVKLADRMKALQWLSDHLEIATDKQRAEIALLKSRADTGKDDRENKLDKFFEQIEGALKDVE